MHATIMTTSETVGWDIPDTRAISLKLLRDYLPTAAVMTLILCSVRAFRGRPAFKNAASVTFHVSWRLCCNR